MIIFIRYISKKIIGYLRNIGVIVYEIPKQYKPVEIKKVLWKMFIDFLQDNKINIILFFIQI